MSFTVLPPPPAHSFIIGPAVINTHTHIIRTGVAAQRKTYAYKQTCADNQNISFLPAIMSTSNRMPGEFLRLLFLPPAIFSPAAAVN
jgi:hypothetical protein